jgi:hypothetical protein
MSAPSGRDAGRAVVDRLDQHRHAEDVGEQNELLPYVVALVPGRGEEGDRGVPFLLGQLDVLDEGVQVMDERPEHLPQAGVRRAGHARGHDVSRAFLAEQLPVRLLLRHGETSLCRQARS